MELICKSEFFIIHNVGETFKHTCMSSYKYNLRPKIAKELLNKLVVCDCYERATSFPGSLFSSFLGRWKKDPGCGLSRYHPESGWQKNLLVGRGGRVFCLVDVTDFVDFKSSSSRL